MVEVQWPGSTIFGIAANPHQIQDLQVSCCPAHHAVWLQDGPFSQKTKTEQGVQKKVLQETSLDVLQGAEDNDFVRDSSRS